MGDVARFADRNRFASWTGTAPIDGSSGEIRHRLSRAGNRRLNHVLYIAAIVQIRHDTPGRAYYRRKLAEGKTPLEGLRCLRRAPLRCGLPPTGHRHRGRRPAHHHYRPGGPGRAPGDDNKPVQRGRPNPDGRPFGHATARTRTRHATPSPTSFPGSRPPRRRARGVNVERPTGRTTLTPTKRRRTLHGRGSQALT